MWPWVVLCVCCQDNRIHFFDVERRKKKRKENKSNEVVNYWTDFFFYFVGQLICESVLLMLYKLGIFLR